MASEVDRLAAGKYVLVTTFRRNGTPVATPVWVVRDGDELVIWTEKNTGKAKRIRNNGEVELAACDLRGRPSGLAVKGRARVLDTTGAAKARRLIKSKFPVTGRIMIAVGRIRHGADSDVGIAISVT